MKKKSTPHQTKNTNGDGIGWAALSLEVLLTDDAETASWQQIFPAGEFQAVDGRPHDVQSGTWLMSQEIAERLIAAVQRLKNRIVVDYEHQTLAAEHNGKPAPASGWISELQWRPGIGLFAKIEWTTRARQFVEDGEYQYLSPVFPYDRATGAVTGLHSVGLTNSPGLDGMRQVAALSATGAQIYLPQEKTMDPLLVQLLEQLGITVSGDQPNEQEGQAALTALVELTATAAAATTAKNELAALKAKGAADIDLARWVPAETYQAVVHEMAALKGQTDQQSAARLIDDARRAGQVLAAEERYLTDYAAQNGVAALKAMIEGRPAVAALSGQAPQVPDTKPPAAGHGLTEAELEAARITGKTAEQYAACKAQK